MEEFQLNRLLRTTLLLILFLLGLLFVAGAFSFFRENSTIRYVVLSIGASMLGSTLVMFAQRITPKFKPEFRIIREHQEIYKKNGEMIHRLIKQGCTHTIRTIYSYRPAPDIEKNWDEKVDSFLQDSDHHYVRVVICKNDPEMNARIAKIEKKYRKTNNHDLYAYEGQPTIEVFLIDDKEVLLSFATTKHDYPYITTAIWSRNRQLCRQLQDFHIRHLQIPEYLMH